MQIDRNASAAPIEGFVRLSDWGVIRAAGEEAASFLQGQLTQDVLSLGASQARLAGYCSAKGRLSATFVIWQDTPGTLLLACSADLLAPTLKRLQMFVLRARCKLSDASSKISLWGLAGSAVAQRLAGGAPQSVWAATGAADHPRTIRLPNGDGTARYLHAAPAGAQAPEGAAISLDEWRWLEVGSAVARIAAATAEQFVPQMVNLEVVGGVSFSKGCFPGQEVVARSQYRGTLKRRAFVLESAVAALPGDEVFHNADATQPAGMVVNSASLGERHRLLAELKLAAITEGSLHLRAADGPALSRPTLPYALPGDAA